MLKKILKGILALALLFIVYLYVQAFISGGNNKAYGGMVANEVAMSAVEPIANDIQRIAFGSCNRQNKSQAYWDIIAAEKPDQWIWLGDNIYGDTDDVDELSNKYAQQKNTPEYQAFVANTKVYGIYDDHDYGVNDGGKEWVLRDTAAAMMLDFLDVPAVDPARSRAGGYQTYLIGESGREIRIILLDTRYFRDELAKNTQGGTQRYQINTTGDILGEAQWKWLEEVLSENAAQVTLLASSIQMLAEEHGYEKWANFPLARTRLLSLLGTYQTENLFLLSGDRHLAELSSGTLLLQDGWDQTYSYGDPILTAAVEANDTFGDDSSVKKEDMPIYSYSLTEVTASGLTHSYEAADEPNRYRISPLIGQRNFGLLTIDWQSDTEPTMLLQLLSAEDGHEFTRLGYKDGEQLIDKLATSINLSTTTMSNVLKPCPESPNCVSTQTSQRKKKMAPLSYTGEQGAAMAKLKSVVEGISRTKLISTDSNYLHFTFKTFPIPFTDDVEFIFDDTTKTIHFRSASRVGHSDLGANARRMKKVTRLWEEATAN